MPYQTPSYQSTPPELPQGPAQIATCLGDLEDIYRRLQRERRITRNSLNYARMLIYHKNNEISERARYIIQAATDIRAQVSGLMVGSESETNTGEVSAVYDSGQSPQMLVPHSPNFTQELEEAFAGRFVKIKKIGQGGMGMVFQAYDPRLARLVAIKICTEADPEALERFRREARATAAIKHPNVVEIHGVADIQGMPYLVLEYLAGVEDGKQHFIENRKENGPLPLQQGLKLALEITKGLRAAHREGILHRDMKPANVLITPDGSVKLSDFGLASIAKRIRELRSQSQSYDKSLTQEGTILGTTMYMAPEVCNGKTSAAGDVYALGLILYEVLTSQGNALEASLGIDKNTTQLQALVKLLEKAGQEGSAIAGPDQDENIRQLFAQNPQLAPQILAFLQDTTAFDWEKRPNIIEVLTRLEDIYEQLSEHYQKLQKLQRRAKILLIGAASGALVVFIALLGLFIKAQQETAQKRTEIAGIASEVNSLDHSANSRQELQEELEKSEELLERLSTRFGKEDFEEFPQLKKLLERSKAAQKTLQQKIDLFEWFQNEKTEIDRLRKRADLDRAKAKTEATLGVLLQKRNGETEAMAEDFEDDLQAALAEIQETREKQLISLGSKFIDTNEEAGPFRITGPIPEVKYDQSIARTINIQCVAYQVAIKYLNEIKKLEIDETSSETCRRLIVHIDEINRYFEDIDSESKKFPSYGGSKFKIYLDRRFREMKDLRAKMERKTRRG